MQQQYNHTIVKTVLQKMRGATGKWRIMLEAYPVYKEGCIEPTRITENLNIAVTTPVFEKTPMKSRKDGNDIFAVKREDDGTILCSSAIDKMSCRLANDIRKLRQDEYDKQNLYTIEEKQLATRIKEGEKDFIQYFDEAIYRLHPNGSKGVIGNWNRTLELLRRFTKNQPVAFKDIDSKFCNDFKYYLLNCSKEGQQTGKGKLSNGTAAQYLSVFKAALKQAFVEDYIQRNISSQVRGISVTKARRDTLDMEEINALGGTKCPRPVVKRAALFSVLTGLRHCDVATIKWKQLRQMSDGWRLDFVQQKTGVPEYLPISDQAYSLCGERGKPDDIIFYGLPKVSECNRAIAQWIKAAGINRHITYHCFRHSFATLLLQHGVDLFTIKSMLGHTRVTTTEIYSHIVDDTKRKAADAIILKKKSDNNEK